MAYFSNYLDKHHVIQSHLVWRKLLCAKANERAPIWKTVVTGDDPKGELVRLTLAGARHRFHASPLDDEWTVGCFVAQTIIYT